MVWLMIREPVRSDAEKTLLTVGVSRHLGTMRVQGGYYCWLGCLLAFSPEGEQVPNINSVDQAIPVDIREWKEFCVTPGSKDECEILPADFTVVGDVCNAVLAISDSVTIAVDIRYPATTNAWCTLFWVKWAVIYVIRYSVVICIFASADIYPNCVWHFLSS